MIRYPYSVASYSLDELQSLIGPNATYGTSVGFIGLAASGTTVEVLYSSALSASAKSALDSFIAGYTPAPMTAAQKLDSVDFPARVSAALTIRMSTQWSSLTAARQQTVQNIIDSAASTIISNLS